MYKDVILDVHCKIYEASFFDILTLIFAFLLRGSNGLTLLLVYIMNCLCQLLGQVKVTVTLYLVLTNVRSWGCHKEKRRNITE